MFDTRVTSYLVTSTDRWSDQGHWTFHTNKREAIDFASDEHITGGTWRVYRRTVTVGLDGVETETLRRIFIETPADRAARRAKGEKS